MSEQEFLEAINDPAIVTPTDEQIREMTSGFGTILHREDIMRLGMKTAIANLKRKLKL